MNRKVALSFVFLWLAFGSVQFVEGQILGKVWMALLAIPLIRFARKSPLLIQSGGSSQ